MRRGFLKKIVKISKYDPYDSLFLRLSSTAIPPYTEWGNNAAIFVHPFQSSWR
jgi:hypothetical protein